MRSAAHRPTALAALALLFTLAGCGARPAAITAPATEEPVLGASRASTGPASASPGRRREPFRVLFVGNSLTYENDLARLVAALSRAAGDDPPLEATSVAYGGFALEDHLVQGDAPRAIAQGGWDVVILQQGPSTLPESRVNLIEYTRRFDPLIRAVGARPALYGVWPDASRRFAFDDGIESYRQAAAAVDGMLFPVALSWKRAWEEDPSLPLYGPDQFHPSRLGTYMAALVIYAELRDQSPVGLPFHISLPNFTYQVDPAQARICQQVAEEITGTKRRPGKPWGPRHPHADAPWLPASPPGRTGTPVPEDID
jgi:hypothetical protein